MNDDRKTLTTRQGHPVADNQSMRSLGERGPATLEHYQFIEKITHFDRERIPERVVHARGTGGIATRITVAGWRAGAGINLEEAKSLPPLDGKPAPGERRQASTYTSGKSEAKEPRATVATPRSAAR